MANDIAMVKRIYAKAGLAWTDRSEVELLQFMVDHPRGKHGRIRYDLEADFGVDPEELRRRFDFYFEQFPVQAER